MWLARLYARLVPSPDLVLFLDADVETMLARKSELSSDELNRQRQAYRQLRLKGSRVELINTSGTREEVAYQVVATIAEFMSQRFVTMHPEWVAPKP
jgi:thymidylate kinase